MYAIVDIETTGGYGRRHRITEIAVVVHDGKQVLDTYQTLLNPDCEIPAFITGLTGIDNEMVQGAPFFEEIGEELYELLKDKVFVAHNVNFDFNFIKSEFSRVGINFERPKLCTIRLSRKLIPGLPSYSLGSICEYMDIEIHDRHRAFGDAEATAILFGILVHRDDQGVIAQAMKRNSGESFLPPHISREQFLELPTSVGVYYFHDEHGKVIYVGKALNIRNRFKGHFSGAGKGKQAMKSAIHHVSYTLTGSEFLALLVEALEIKKHWPRFNRALKVKAGAWGLYQYQDGKGYMRFQVSKINKFKKPLITFRTHHDAWSYLLKKVEEFKLCPKLCGIQKTPGACYDFESGFCDGACAEKEDSSSYNDKVLDWLGQIPLENQRMLIKEKGRNPEEEAAIYFDQGILKAYGFLDLKQEFQSDEEVVLQV
ncbi:exonuclease domain-containing protein [Echinicola jeungdonensis]|uniref:exonuclease domain-containing protein n=1 Tax=Echinicola jeungdonensis TaxID=709343 RepID=UPI00338E92F0